MYECVKGFDYAVMDECYGVVSSRCGDGVFLTLDNGEKAYATRFGNLHPGDKVICRIEKLAQGDMKPLVSISSVCGYSMLVA